MENIESVSDQTTLTPVPPVVSTPSLQTIPSRHSPWLAITATILFLGVVGYLGYQNYQLKQQLTSQQSTPTSQEEMANLQQQIDVFISQSDQEPSSETNQIDVANEEDEEVTPAGSPLTEKASGFIKQVYDKDGKNFLDIDYIQWLTEEDCKAKNLECNPNGYLVLNQNTQIRTFEISDDVDIIADMYNNMETNGIKMFYETFKSIFAIDSNSYSKDSIYWITTEDNIVTSIREQYQP